MCSTGVWDEKQWADSKIITCYTTSYGTVDVSCAEERDFHIFSTDAGKLLRHLLYERCIIQRVRSRHIGGGSDTYSLLVAHGWRCLGEAGLSNFKRFHVLCGNAAAAVVKLAARGRRRISRGNVIKLQRALQTVLLNQECAFDVLDVH